MNPDSQSIGDRIRELRDVAQLTQGQLAELAGIDQGTVSKVEAGTVIPRHDTVQAIEQAIRATVRQRLVSYAAILTDDRALMVATA